MTFQVFREKKLSLVLVTLVDSEIVMNRRLYHKYLYIYCASFEYDSTTQILFGITYCASCCNLNGNVDEG